MGGELFMRGTYSCEIIDNRVVYIVVYNYLKMFDLLGYYGFGR